MKDLEEWDDSVEYTYEELAKESKEEWESMCEEEQYHRIVNGDSTFLEYVLSHIKIGDKVIVSENNKTYEIL